MSSALFPALLFVLSLSIQAQADGLGRLFFTPDERRQLDRQYARDASGDSGAYGRSAMTANGLVQRSDGGRTVWINGKAQHGTAGKSINATPVTVPGKSGSIEVQVGQRLQPGNPPPKNEIQRAPQRGE